MKLTKTCLFLSASAALLIGSVGSAFADTKTANIPVSANVKKSCSITAAAITFVDYDPLATVANVANGSVTIACTKGSVTPIGLGLGSHADGTTRRMLNGISNYLTYELHQTSATGPNWGNADPDLFSPEAAPDKNARTFTVYGAIPAGQDQPEGTYTDTVVATVNF
jgi:spore coat protein U-like protein